MNKVVVTKEVAEAINDILNGRNGRTLNSFGILNHLDNVAVYECCPKLRVLNDYYNDTEQESPRHPIALMRALVIGYEVEKLPEEKVSELYRSYVESGLQSEAAAIRVAFTNYGIKIAGINE